MKHKTGQYSYFVSFFYLKNKKKERERSMNKIIVRGRPTTDPKSFYEAEEGEGTGKRVMNRWTIAVNRTYQRNGEAKADFIPCVAYGRPAKLIESYVKKGTHILVSGRIENNNYTSKTGEKVYSFQLVVETVEVLNKIEVNNDNNPEDENADGFMNIPDDIGEDLPFTQKG